MSEPSLAAAGERDQFFRAGGAAVEHLVAAGFGVALLPSLALQAYRHPQIAATPLPTSRRHLSALTFGRPPNAPQIDALLRVLTEVRMGHRVEH